MGPIRAFHSGPLAAAILLLGCVSVNDATALSGQLSAEFKRSASVTLDGQHHLIVTLRDDAPPPAPDAVAPQSGTATRGGDTSAQVAVPDNMSGTPTGTPSAATDSTPRPAPSFVVESPPATPASADGTVSSDGLLEQRIARFAVEHFAHAGAVRTVTVILEPAATNGSADPVVSTWTAAELAPPGPPPRPATRSD